MHGKISRPILVGRPWRDGTSLANPASRPVQVGQGRLTDRTGSSGSLPSAGPNEAFWLTTGAAECRGYVGLYSTLRPCRSDTNRLNGILKHITASGDGPLRNVDFVFCRLCGNM